jgi:hypothetical protein
MEKLRDVRVVTVPIFKLLRIQNTCDLAKRVTISAFELIKTSCLLRISKYSKYTKPANYIPRKKCVEISKYLIIQRNFLSSKRIFFGMLEIPF